MSASPFILVCFLVSVAGGPGVSDDAATKVDLFGAAGRRKDSSAELPKFPGKNFPAKFAASRENYEERGKLEGKLPQDLQYSGREGRSKDQSFSTCPGSCFP